jgi:hypothetical protein
LKGCFKHLLRANVALLLTVSSFSVTSVLAQEPAADSVSAPIAQVPGETPDDRIFGVIPNYLTVENPQPNVAPLTVKQKFGLFAKETFDPFTFAASAAGAALSQIDNDNPKYGRGAGPYAERFGAAMADITTQNFFSDAVLASWLHEDPRYFRRGPEFGVWYRVGYALSRVVVTRTDAGKNRFNYSGVLGTGLGIGLSNAYYPDASVSGREVLSRFGTSFAATALGNLLPEFWPDIHEKLLNRKVRSHSPPPVSAPPAPGG